MSKALHVRADGGDRRLLTEKIALHISDFTPRLRSNTRALYQVWHVLHAVLYLCSRLLSLYAPPSALT